MLIELAIGDTYGVGFEFRSEEFVLVHNRLKEYFPHERYDSLHKRYSDDTQMSIALAELIIEGIDWTPINIADKFVEVFQRDVRSGYSSRMYKALTASNRGTDFLSIIDNNSEGSGAAMRSGVIGLFKSEDEILEKAALQARVTHNTVTAIKSAQAVALATHYFAYSLGAKHELQHYILKFIDIDWIEEWDKPVDAQGEMCTMAAFTAIKSNKSMAELLKACISFTGDVDTVAAIALGMASFSTELDQDLPQWMYDELENDAYGRDYLMKLDQCLKRLFF